jgi:hypothetical protein
MRPQGSLLTCMCSHCSHAAGLKLSFKVLYPWDRLRRNGSVVVAGTPKQRAGRCPLCQGIRLESSGRSLFTRRVRLCGRQNNFTLNNHASATTYRIGYSRRHLVYRHSYGSNMECCCASVVCLTSVTLKAAVFLCVGTVPSAMLNTAAVYDSACRWSIT